MPASGLADKVNWVTLKPGKLTVGINLGESIAEAFICVVGNIIGPKYVNNEEPTKFEILTIDGKLSGGVTDTSALHEKNAADASVNAFIDAGKTIVVNAVLV